MLYKILLMTKQCVICGKHFETERYNAVTCSATCRQRNWRKSNLRKGIMNHKKTSLKGPFFVNNAIRENLSM